MIFEMPRVNFNYWSVIFIRITLIFNDLYYKKNDLWYGEKLSLLRKKMINHCNREKVTLNYQGNDRSFSPVFLSLILFFSVIVSFSLFLLVCFFSLVSSLPFLLIFSLVSKVFLSSFFSQVFSPKKRTRSQLAKCVWNP